MTKVIAIANQKGGVGKTSTTVNLGAGLVRQGFDVLLVDMDSQANLTMALGFQNPDEMQFTIANVLQKAVREETIIPEEGILTNEEGIDLMPSNVQLSGVELSLINEYGREAVLKQYITSFDQGNTQALQICRDVAAINLNPLRIRHCFQLLHSHLDFDRSLLSFNINKLIVAASLVLTRNTFLPQSKWFFFFLLYV